VSAAQITLILTELIDGSAAIAFPHGLPAIKNNLTVNED
jgi:hypothetical protein